MYRGDDWSKCLEDFLESQIFKRIKAREENASRRPWGGSMPTEDEPEHPGDFISPVPEPKAIDGPFAGAAANYRLCLKRGNIGRQELV
jgi:hypothetical protein